MSIRPTLAAAAILVAGIVPLAAQSAAPAPLPLPASTMNNPLVQAANDPVWQKMFIGDLAFRASGEPKITTAEQEILMAAQPLLAANNIAGARMQIETATNAIPNDGKNVGLAALQATVGNLYFAEGNLAQARNWYNRSLQIYPDFLRVHKSLGMIAIREGTDYEAAVKHLAKAIELGEGDSRTFGLLGFAYQNLDKPMSAEACYRRALIGDPETKDWKLGLAGTLFAQSRYAEARAVYRELLLKDPNNADYWQLDANCSVALNEYDTAATTFEIARRMGKIRPDALVLLGNLYVQKELFELALGAFQEAITNGADTLNIESAISAARTLSNFAAYPQARQLITGIRRGYGNRVSAQSDRDLLTLETQVLLGEGKVDEAAEILQRVVAADPLNASALMQLARIFEGRGDGDRAMSYLERAAQLPDQKDRVPALRRLGQLLVRQKKFDEALRYLNEAQSISPDTNLSNFIQQVDQARRFQAATQG